MNDHFTKISSWKRVLSLFVVVAVVFAGFPLMVHASSFEPVQQPMNDLFDFQLIDKRPLVSDNNGNFHIEFDLGSYTYVGYVEFLLLTPADIVSVSVNDIACEVVKDRNYYRVFCKPGVAWYDIYLDIHCSGYTYVVLCSAEYSSNSYTSQNVPCQIESVINGNVRNFNYSDGVLDVFSSQSDYLDNLFTVRFYFNNVEVLDYINLSFVFRAWSIDSISVGSADTHLIPFDVSYLDIPSNPDYSNDDPVYDIFTKICIDLSNLDLSRTSTYIVLSITGSLRDQGSNYAYLKVLGSHGFVLTSPVNPVIFWFRKTYHGLNTWFDSLLDVLQNIYNGNTAPGNSFQQQVDQKDQQLEDMAAVMESVEQPDLNSINVSANTYVDGTVLASSMSGITSVFSEGLFFDVIVMSIMMATAGYVLFGKR